MTKSIHASNSQLPRQQPRCDPPIGPLEIHSSLLGSPNDSRLARRRENLAASAGRLRDATIAPLTLGQWLRISRNIGLHGTAWRLESSQRVGLKIPSDMKASSSHPADVVMWCRQHKHHNAAQGTCELTNDTGKLRK